MPEAKTKPTGLSVKAYLDAIEDESRRKDCREIAALMKRVTGCTPKMWGTSIIGFDQYHYKYASGREGDSCVVGFSSRKESISLYLHACQDGTPTHLGSLGRFTRGKGCVYVKQLADINLPVLEKLVAHSVAEIKRRYPALKT